MICRADPFLTHSVRIAQRAYLDYFDYVQASMVKQRRGLKTDQADRSNKKMNNDKKIELVSILLDEYGKAARQKSIGDMLDVEWLNSLQETSTLKLILRSLDVDKKWLQDNGFVIGAMLLKNF